MEGHDWDCDGGLQVDWIQANWELLVERELLVPVRYLTSPFIPQGNRQIERSVTPEFYVSVDFTVDSSEVSEEAANSIRILKACKVRRVAGFCTAIPGGHGFYRPCCTTRVLDDFFVI